MSCEIHCYFHGVSMNTIMSTQDLWLNLLSINDFADQKGRRQATPLL